MNADSLAALSYRALGAVSFNSGLNLPAFPCFHVVVAAHSGSWDSRQCYCGRLSGYVTGFRDTFWAAG